MEKLKVEMWAKQNVAERTIDIYMGFEGRGKYKIKSIRMKDLVDDNPQTIVKEEMEKLKATVLDFMSKVDDLETNGELSEEKIKKIIDELGVGDINGGDNKEEKS